MKVISRANCRAIRFAHRLVFLSREFRKTAAAGFFLFFSVLLFAQDDYRSAEITRPIPQLHVVNKTVFPHSTTLYELSNGLTLFIQKTEKNTATVRAYIKNTGSVYEGEYLGSGISHLTEQIVCAGSTVRRNEEEMRQLLERLGGSFGALTNKEMTSYFINCLTEQVPTAIDLLSDWLTYCEIDPDEFTRKKNVIAQQLANDENNPDYVENELLAKTVYRAHPYRLPISGYGGAFDALTCEDVKHFYETHYTPNNTVFLVAGNVAEEDVLGRMINLYREVPRGRELEQCFFAEPAQIAPREICREMPGQTYRLLLAWPTVRYEDGDARPLDVLATLLTGGTSGWLERRLIGEKQIGFSYEAESCTPSSTHGFFLIRSEARSEELESARAAVLDQIRQISETGVSDEELVRAKKLRESAFIFEREALAVSAEACVKNYIMTGNPNFDETSLDAIRKVSPADITRVVRTYFRPEKQNSVLITPPGMTPASVAPKETEPNSKIDGFHLRENGLTILAKRVPSVPIVTVQIYAIAGSLAETETTAGVTALLAEMLSCGTETRSKTEIENYFDSIGGKLSFSAGRNTLTGKMTVLKGDFKEAFPIFADMLLHPAFSETEFQKAKKLQIDSLAVQQRDPNQQIFNLLSDSLPPSTHYHLRPGGTAESVKKIRIEDLRRVHREILVPNKMVVTIFGDIDTKDAVHTAQGLFAALPNPSGKPAIPFDRDNQFVRQPDEHRQTDIRTGRGIIAWPTVSIRDEKEYDALTVLQGVLGGYKASGGRLFNTLRDDGLVLQLAVDQLTGPAPGYFYVSFETAPDKIGVIFDRIEEAVEQIKGGDLPEDELDRVKAQIIAQHRLQLETIDAQAESAALDDLFGLGYKNGQRFADRINSVTRDDVITAAQSYLTRPAKVSISGNDSRD